MKTPYSYAEPCFDLAGGLIVLRCSTTAADNLDLEPLYPKLGAWLPDVLASADVLLRHSSFVAVQITPPGANSVGEVQGGHLGA